MTEERWTHEYFTVQDGTHLHEFDRPLAKTHRMWRELPHFTGIVLPGKGHLSAVMPGFIPQAYIDAMVRFITAHNPS